MNSIIKKILFGIFFISVKLFSQQFYVNTKSGSLNKVFKLDIINTTQTEETTCPPTNFTTDTYGDIAVDGLNNIYYVGSYGDLYKKDVINSICSYLGNFHPTSVYPNVNSLVLDSGNYLYTFGNIIGGSNHLDRYNISTGTFTDLGIIPNQISGGDLFFYESRLFLLTTTNSILEINMTDPSQSCNFMTTNLPNLYAAFSVNYGTYSKVYILNYDGVNSNLYEVDMVNKQIGNLIRSYNYQIYGAATYYNLTSTNSSCTINLGVQENTTNDIYFNIINPAKNNIICQTNIERKQITLICLFDNSGRLIKDFSNQNNIDRLDISGISNGTYLLTLSTKKGETYTKKIIITS